MTGETHAEESGWTVDTLHVHLIRIMADQREMLDERYATSVKALDAAFRAQQLAMETAFTAADKATQAALAAAEKAVTKAELSADKRFESVNEFRAQLADQASTFLSRVESDAKFTALNEKLDGMVGTNSERFGVINQRLDTASGQSTGASALWGYLIGAIGVIVAVVAIVNTLLA